MISSESIAPSSPKSAPEAPTEILFLMKREERILPPSPDRRYITPIRTARSQPKENVRLSKNIIASVKSGKTKP